MGQDLGLDREARKFPLSDRFAEMGGIPVNDDGTELFSVSRPTVYPTINRRHPPERTILTPTEIAPNRRGEVGRHGSETPSGSRWVVERTLAWLSKCRAILVRYDKKASNYIGLIQLACALIWYRRQWQLRVLR